MKYFSETLNELFDSEEALIEAEKEAEDQKKKAELEAKERKEQRQARAKEVEDAYQIASDAKKKADELLNAFVKDYNSFHMSIKSPIKGIFDDLFTLF